jgi:hypothetical protein
MLALTWGAGGALRIGTLKSWRAWPRLLAKRGEQVTACMKEAITGVNHKRQSQETMPGGMNCFHGRDVSTLLPACRPAEQGASACCSPVSPEPE